MYERKYILGRVHESKHIYEAVPWKGSSKFGRNYIINPAVTEYCFVLLCNNNLKTFIKVFQQLVRFPGLLWQSGNLTSQQCVASPQAGHAHAEQRGEEMQRKFRLDSISKDISIERSHLSLLLKVAAHAHAEQLRPRNAWKIQFLLIPPRQAFNWALSDSIPVDWLSRLILATQSDDFEWWKTSSSTVVNNHTVKVSWKKL